ncbi:hypothetical protein IFM89_016076 [Coptis chinensis]|uniref:Uncharacterized protein n=1 Tax=Coptis chinensis TaxID=261450 RepID=A0A835M861_9MAGN|nr:hypothetical protein IFM89_016076 [Coptis chinensis]
MSTSLLHQPIPPFLTSSSPSVSSSQLTNLSFYLNPSTKKHHCHKRPTATVNLKKKNPWLDPYDYGEDPKMERGSLYSEGKQDEDPRPPENPNNPYGFLKFPYGYNVEIALLG